MMTVRVKTYRSSQKHTSLAWMTYFLTSTGWNLLGVSFVTSHKEHYKKIIVLSHKHIIQQSFSPVYVFNWTTSVGGQRDDSLYPPQTTAKVSCQLQSVTVEDMTLWNRNSRDSVAFPPPSPQVRPVTDLPQQVYTLTYSMVQSPSWEAKWFAASQEIPCILWNPKVHYHTHKPPPPVPILGQPNPVHIPTSHLLEIHPNIIHPSMPRSPQWSLSLRLPYQDPICPPLLTHTRHMPSPSHSSWFYHPHNSTGIYVTYLSWTNIKQ